MSDYTTYFGVVKHIGFLLDNNSTTQEAEKYLRGFVRNQCDVTKEVTKAVADKAIVEAVAAEREAAKGLVEALEVVQGRMGGVSPLHPNVCNLVNTAIATYRAKNEKD